MKKKHGTYKSFIHLTYHTSLAVANVSVGYLRRKMTLANDENNHKTAELRYMPLFKTWTKGKENKK